MAAGIHVPAGDARAALCRLVEADIPRLLANAVDLDDKSLFPTSDLAELAKHGLLLAPFPEAFGGLGMGTQPAGGAALCALLRALGRGNLSIGRLFEAHVNAVRLLAKLAGPALLQRAAQDAADGHLFGLWVTDGPTRQCTAQAGYLRGEKAFCSGAGHIRRAVMLVTNADGCSRLAYINTEAATCHPTSRKMRGMRAAATARVTFDGCSIGDSDWLGPVGAYLTEPDFSAGAWRTCAVTCGGLEMLIDLALQHLATRNRAHDPHQQMRIGQIWIARQTALMWLDRACDAAESDDDASETQDHVATVNFARIAIESACLSTITLVELSLGLAAFLGPDPIERISRDLATYLRQPARDEIIVEAAAHILRTRIAAA